MGAFKLGKMTFGSLYKKPETLLYPFQTKEAPVGLKGHIAIDAESCILCGACDRACTTNCITVDKQVSTWSINRYQCVQCGYCTTVCPKKCLSMDSQYAKVAPSIANDTFNIPVKQKGKANLADSGEDTGDSKKSKLTQNASAKTNKESEKLTINSNDKMAKDMSKSSPSEDISNYTNDEQLSALLKLMGEEKARKVRNALGDIKQN